jgi:opacity protein-like surface antigen
MNRCLRGLALAALVLLAAAPLQAQDQGSLSLGLGIVKPEDIDSTLYVTANYRFKLTGSLVLEPEVGIWEKSEGEGDVEISLRDLNFGANLLYVSDMKKTKLWGGAGLGAHLIKGTLGIGGLGSESESDTRLGLHLLGGVDYEMGKTVDLYGAVRYDLVSLEGDANLNQAKLYAGVRYRF